MEPYSTPPPDQSDQEPTLYEQALLIEAVYVPGLPFEQLWRHDEWSRRDVLMALRTGHEAGRRSVLEAPIRVWREGDPPPERKVMLFNVRDVVGEWVPRDFSQIKAQNKDWEYCLANYGPLFGLPMPVDFAAALATDAARRRALRDGAL